MGGRGPVPADRKVRRNLPTRPTVLDVPTPLDRPLTGDWSDAVRRWWSNWCRSPQATRFGDTDWQRLEMLACLVDLYHANPTPALMAEIRLNEERLGATVADRKRLGWELPSADTPPGPKRSTGQRPRIVDHQATA